MPFDTLADRLKTVALGSLTKCRNEWGANGLRIEVPISPQISWQPTFFLKPDRMLLVAVEANDVLFPELLKIAAHDIEHYDFPIAIYQACSLDVYQSDTRQAKVNLLRDHGFGLITVDDRGMATIQVPAIPYAQHIPPEALNTYLRPLAAALKVKFRGAYSSYRTDAEQGLQRSSRGWCCAFRPRLREQARYAPARRGGTRPRSSTCCTIRTSFRTTGHNSEVRETLFGLIATLQATLPGVQRRQRRTLGGARLAFSRHSVWPPNYSRSFEVSVIAYQCIKSTI